MPGLIECVPNFSEGRDDATLAALRHAIDTAPGVALLDVHADPFHHRSVFTFVGAPDAACEAVLRAVRTAVERIDLTRHRGEHPRIGACDVVPFVPLPGMALTDCVALATDVARRLTRELDIPAYLYARAARRPDRETLAHLRRGGFERLRERIATDPALAPDFGSARVHPTAGAVAVGARHLLVAFNVWLASDDVALARRIARAIRASDGGLPAVQAMGLSVAGQAQVSTNVLDGDVTGPGAVFQAVRREAARAGVAVERAEIVGLIPERAIAGWEEWGLGEPIEDKILERRIRDSGMAAYRRPVMPPPPPPPS